MRKILIALFVMIIVLVVADRIALLIAERKISDRVASAYDLPAKPGVSIAGFPFLTQVVAGKYHSVDIRVRSVTADGVPVTGLDARLTGVRASIAQLLGRSPEPVTAQHASATATVPLSAVRSRLPRGITLRPDGAALRVGGTAHYFGLDLPVSAMVQPAASPSGIILVPRQVHVGKVVSVPAATLAGRLRIAVPLGTLPLHLKVTSVRVEPAGLRISAAGQDVHFAATG
jgi:hypothetical protein